MARIIYITEIQKVKVITSLKLSYSILTYFNNIDLGTNLNWHIKYLKNRLIFRKDYVHVKKHQSLSSSI